MPDVTIKWRGALDADANTDYKIKADHTTPGTFADLATQDATTPFAPVSTTLNGALTPTATTVILTSGTSFSQGDVIQVDREMILLGTKSTDTFTNCTRGYAATTKQSHSNGATVWKAHESYVDVGRNFGTRKLIRYQVLRIQATVESVVAETLAMNPPAPPTNDFCTVYGVYQDLTNDVQSSVATQMDIGGVDDYMVSTGELIKQASETGSTDNDGFWSFSVPKTAARTQNASITIKVGTGASAKTYTLVTVPDQDSAAVEDCI